jgi:uncharacterized membrane protein
LVLFSLFTTLAIVTSLLSFPYNYHCSSAVHIFLYFPTLVPKAQYFSRVRAGGTLIILWYLKTYKL